MERIYLDNAATSWPKPESVYQAVEHYQRDVGAPAGRSAFRQSNEVRRLIAQTRLELAQFIHAPADHHVVFTFSGTDSLSTAILGLLNPGDHVVTSVVEHNSVLRPLHDLETHHNLAVTRVGCDEHGRFDAQEVIDSILPETRLVVLTHVSNVTGAIQPIEPVGQWCQQNDIPFLVDAAQSLGHLPINVQALGCDMLAAPGHKGLMGPLGTGILYLSDTMAEKIRPLRFGGTGGGLDRQPESLPEKFESGNLNVPGIVGLQAGLRFIQSEIGQLHQAQSKSRSEILLDGLVAIRGIKLQGPPKMVGRVGLFSMTLEHFDCHEGAAILDTTWSIQTRAGNHCAPLLHRAVGTEALGGTLRMSPGPFNTLEQIELTLEAIAALTGE